MRKASRRGVLNRIFSDQGVDPPKVVPWPLPNDLEEDRQQRAKRFSSILDRGMPPGLEWMEGHRQAKYDPSYVLPGCRSVFVAAMGYFREDPEDSQRETFDASPSGRIARYARGRDYHKEFGYRLKRIARFLKDHFPTDEFRAFTDIGPLDERWLAEISGLGFTGVHGLTIHRRHGSWMVLGHLLSTLPADDFIEEALVLKGPLSCPPGCRRCLDVCPTDALKGHGVLDAGRCLSYLTIERKEPLDESFRQSLGEWVFGCDLCQEVCPFNRRVEVCQVPAFLEDRAGPRVDLREILEMKTREDFVKRFAGSPVMRAGMDKLRESACVSAALQGARELRDAIGLLTASPNPDLRSQAHWALEVLETIR